MNADYDDYDDEDAPPPPVLDPVTGRIRLCATRCDTCVFRPGNLMHLTPGRLKTLVETAIAKEGHIVCHDTLDHRPEVPGAICRGFAQHPAAARSIMLRILMAARNGTLVDPATGTTTDTDTALPALPLKQDPDDQATATVASSAGKADG